MNTAVVEKPTVNIWMINPGATGGRTNEISPDAITTTPDRLANIEALGARLLDASVQYEVPIKGGDGTVNCAVVASVKSGQRVNITLDPEGSGYKKDLTAMVEDAGGDNVPVRPLVLERLERSEEGDKWAQVDMAAYSIGIGGRMVAGAALANSPAEFRQDRDARIERWIARGASPKAAKIIASIRADAGLILRLLGSEIVVDGKGYPTSTKINGEEVGAYIASNGQRMSGVMRFWDNNLEQRGFTTTVIKRGTARTLFGMVMRLLSADPLHDKWVTGHGDRLTLAEETAVVVDGEVIKVKPGTYRIRQMEETAVTLSLRSKDVTAKELASVNGFARALGDVATHHTNSTNGSTAIAISKSIV